MGVVSVHKTNRRQKNRPGLSPMRALSFILYLAIAIPTMVGLTACAPHPIPSAPVPCPVAEHLKQRSSAPPACLGADPFEVEAWKHWAEHDRSAEAIVLSLLIRNSSSPALEASWHSESSPLLAHILLRLALRRGDIDSARAWAPHVTLDPDKLADAYAIVSYEGADPLTLEDLLLKSPQLNRDPHLLELWGRITRSDLKRAVARSAALFAHHRSGNEASALHRARLLATSPLHAERALELLESESSLRGTLLRASLLLALGEHREALAHLDNVRARTRHPIVLEAAARMMLALGRRSELHALHQHTARLLMANPLEDPAFLPDLIRILFTLERPREALFYAEHLLQLRAADTDALLSMATALRLASRGHEAELYETTALAQLEERARQSTAHTPTLEWVHLLGLLSQADVGIEHLEPLVADHPEDPRIVREMSLLYERDDQLEPAYLEAVHATELDPSSFTAWRTRARLEESTGRDATASMSEALELRPWNLELRRRLHSPHVWIDVLAWPGLSGDAWLSVLELELLPPHVEAWLTVLNRRQFSAHARLVEQLAEAHRVLGQSHSAQRAAEAATQLSASATPLLDHITWLLLQGDHRSARPLFRKVLSGEIRWIDFRRLERLARYGNQEDVAQWARCMWKAQSPCQAPPGAR